jgi:uncharacterized repeat protein (TIGR02543 family)
VKLRIMLPVSFLLAVSATLAFVAVVSGEQGPRGSESGLARQSVYAMAEESDVIQLVRTGTPAASPHELQLAGRDLVLQQPRSKEPTPGPGPLEGAGGPALKDQAQPGSRHASSRSMRALGAASYPAHPGSDAADDWWKYRIFLPLAGRLYHEDPAVVSDDFHTSSLNHRLWKLADPRGDATLAMIGSFTRDAWLCISVPGSSAHNIWEDGNNAARVMQSVRDSDFEIEVKFESGVSQKYQMQGILIEQDQRHFLRLEFHSDGVGTRIYAASFAPGSADTLEPTVRLTQRIFDQPNVAPLYMRVRHVGDRWTLFWSGDGLDWSTAVSFRHHLSVTKAGSYAGNAGAAGQAPPAHTACFDYFFNTGRPITPEDRPLFSVAASVVGDGQIAMEPAQPKYHLSDIVTVTAIADPGWSFTGWSGDLSGTDNPAALTIDGDKAVTATFNMEEYTLGVNVVGKGTVARDPDQAVYHYGDVVDLTAVPDPGWSFAGWGGDLSGTDNPETITMDEDKVVTATFTQDEYTLTVNLVGEGTVSKDPDQAVYHYGDVVDLTPVPDPGWSFVGWSGDLSGTDNPETITMDEDKVVTATFTQDEYTLTVNLVGEGTVSKDPDQALYHYGDAVDLTAVPDPGWSFAGWSGDLSGTDNPETITMDEDKVVTATFTQDEYTLTVNVVGEGTVSKEPDQAVYHYGDMVDVTAVPEVGWSFAGWSGDLSGSDNPETITVDENKVVTATFAQD